MAYNPDAEFIKRQQQRVYEQARIQAAEAEQAKYNQYQDLKNQALQRGLNTGLNQIADQFAKNNITTSTTISGTAGVSWTSSDYVEINAESKIAGDSRYGVMIQYYDEVSDDMKEEKEVNDIFKSLKLLVEGRGAGSKYKRFIRQLDKS